MAPIAPGTGAVPSLCQVVRAAKWHVEGHGPSRPDRQAPSVGGAAMKGFITNIESIVGKNDAFR